MVDIDGTLLGRDRAISAKDREALARSRALGVMVTLSTGRAAAATSHIINQLSLDGYHVFFDGALVSKPNQGEELYVKPLDKAVLRQAIEFAHLNDISIEFYSVAHYFAERETWSTNIRRRFFDIQPTIQDFTNLWQQERIIKGTLTVSSPEERARAKSFCTQFKSTLNFSCVTSIVFRYCPSIVFHHCFLFFS